ncbi:unnamed protein product [Zymoseptoria tritici ST99CH_1E4]|uniref:N-acetylgalactosaminide beta-1,3-galactosyltransferase n=1 Tax=Zymoseptoria tritici ST99CH_1E4 TaxID=1276532 RepID=A0A2H1GFR8_ZYMTR|nr:unnamed protein product [Zymoseptoria tritici ST99CH_1E4]
MTRRALWQICLSIAVICSATIALLFWTDVPLKTIGFPGKQHDDEKKIPTSKYYPFRTYSAFGTSINDTTSKSATREQLCEHFPKALLRDIQPVLKVGHGVVQTRARNSLNSCSACIDDLLIFSDFDEELEGRPIINVISDLPAEHQEQEQLIPWKAMNGLPVNGSIMDPEITGRQGWELDKFKFLLSISRAWRMRPEKRWYVFYEGDTFVVWDNVFRWLANFDPDTPQYFGSPSPGREDKGERVWFANGGPGYIISRAAMRRLVKNDFDQTTGEYLGSKFTESHWGDVLTDCCGDSVLGWALWQEQVRISGVWPSMNPHPLHGVPFSDQHWCQPVMSMHKVHEKDMVDLWRWEWAHRDFKRPFLYRDLALSYLNLTAMQRRNNWDNAAWDGSDAPAGAPHVSADSCESACTSHGGCFQWTYHRRRCTFVRSFRLGDAKEPTTPEPETDGEWTAEDQQFIAGWDTKSIAKWADERPCKEIQWLRPSLSRII